MKPGILWAFGKLLLVAALTSLPLKSTLPKSMAHTKEGEKTESGLLSYTEKDGKTLFIPYYHHHIDSLVERYAGFLSHSDAN